MVISFGNMSTHDWHEAVLASQTSDSAPQLRSKSIWISLIKEQGLSPT